MIAVREPPRPLVRRSRAADSKASAGDSIRSHRLAARAVSVVVVLMLCVTLTGGGDAVDAASALAVQARAAALEARWADMISQGVDPSDLAKLRLEAAEAESSTWFGVPIVFFSPDTNELLGRWEAQTSAIWTRSVSNAREGALAAERRLQALLPNEPPVVRKERLAQLSVAATPAQFEALREEWNLQADLVPIDRAVADEVGELNALVDQARSLGILTTPAPAVLKQAAGFAALPDARRLTRSEPLLRLMLQTAGDLSGRIAAAQRAKQAFKQAADEMSTAALYGVDVRPYQQRIDADTRAYATATSAAALDAVTNDLVNNVVGGLKKAIATWMSQVHVVAGITFYRQTHALSCEEAATSMALTHQGIYLSQDQILAEMGADLRPMYRDASGRMRWGDPYVSFVGSVDGSMTNYTGYQANYPPLVRVAAAHGARILAYGYMTAATIYARVAAGHPVVAWATWDWAWHPRHDYIAFDGRSVPWIGPTYASHVYTVVGVRADAVLVDDPIRGQYWVGKGAFEAGYSDFNEAIVFA